MTLNDSNVKTYGTLNRFFSGADCVKVTKDSSGPVEFTSCTGRAYICSASDPYLDQDHDILQRQISLRV